MLVQAVCFFMRNPAYLPARGRQGTGRNFAGEISGHILSADPRLPKQRRCTRCGSPRRPRRQRDKMAKAVQGLAASGGGRQKDLAWWQGAMQAKRRARGVDRRSGFRSKLPRRAGAAAVAEGRGDNRARAGANAAPAAESTAGPMRSLLARA